VWSLLVKVFADKYWEPYLEQLEMYPKPKRKRESSGSTDEKPPKRTQNKSPATTKAPVNNQAKPTTEPKSPETTEAPADNAADPIQGHGQS
jgi:hypothetical protein